MVVVEEASRWCAVWLAVSLACWSCGSSEPSPDVRRATREREPLSWEHPKLKVVVQPPPAGSDLTQGELAQAVRLAGAAWKSACSAVDFEIVAAPRLARVQRDGVNSVTVRSRRWCPDDAMRSHDCYDPRLHALTVLHKLPPGPAAADARIAEADIEINAVEFDWSASRDGSGQVRRDRLQAVLVHELGHFLGLDHPCGGNPRRIANSHEGAPQRAADCGAYQNQAMHPDPLAQGRRLVLEPSQGELNAVCAIYPAASATARAPFGWLWVPVAVLLATVLVGARRWSRKRRAP